MKDKAANSTYKAEKGLNLHVKLAREVFRRLGVEPQEFDTNGKLLGGTDGLLDTTSGTPRFRPYRPSDLVTMTVRYEVSDLEMERETDTFRQLAVQLERMLPVPGVRKSILSIMAKTALDGDFAWMRKMILWFIAPKDYGKTTLMKIFAMTLGDLSIDEDSTPSHFTCHHLHFDPLLTSSSTPCLPGLQGSIQSSTERLRARLLPEARVEEAVYPTGRGRAQGQLLLAVHQEDDLVGAADVPPPVL